MDEHRSRNMQQLLSLTGKVAVITGAAMRIGREMAHVFARQGAAVVIADIAREQGAQVAAEICAGGGDAVFLYTDVGIPQHIQAMVAHTLDRYGRLDVLINNAHWEKRGTVLEIEEADWDRSMDVLLKAMYLGCKYAIPAMREAGGGSILNMSSVHAVHVSDAYVTYQTAKAAILQFTRQVAWDFGPHGIRCNAICPGAIRRPEDVAAATASDPLWLEEATLLTPLRRLGHPHDIALAALFLCSDMASWITGQALTVDGGEFMPLSTVGLGRMREWLVRHPERLQQ
jgi:NAD(P)-dependent dehydrogenase (short-subunit alcohol dehydrogenase family)